MNHYNKWTSQFIGQCSTSPYLSTYHSSKSKSKSKINNSSYNQNTRQLRKQSSYSHLEIPEDYSSYFRSLSKKYSQKKFQQTNKYEYLKQLPFVNRQSIQKCSQQCLTKKKQKKQAIKYFKKENEQAVNQPVVTNHIHTIQTVFVPTPTPPIYLYPAQTIISRQQDVGYGYVKRCSSAPKVSFNYVSPCNFTNIQLNRYVNSQRQNNYTSRVLFR